MPKAERWQRIARWVAVGSSGIGLAGASGCVTAGLPAGGVVWLHPVLFALGAGAGWLAALRLDEIDRRRWEIVSDGLLTRGEVREAHRHAESRRRWAALWLLGAPLMLGYALASHTAEAEAGVAVHLLAATAIVGGFAGLLAGRRRTASEQGPPPGR